MLILEPLLFIEVTSNNDVSKEIVPERALAASGADNKMFTPKVLPAEKLPEFGEKYIDAAACTIPAGTAKPTIVIARNKKAENFSFNFCTILFLFYFALITRRWVKMRQTVNNNKIRTAITKIKSALWANEPSYAGTA